MKFKFTTTPLKDLHLGSVVDGFCIDRRSHTGKNAEGYKCTTKRLPNGYMKPATPFQRVLLIYSEGVPA